MIKKAVIMAAGRGTRLGERGRLSPKGFLRIGERPIIEESIERLRGQGVEEIIIVTGHLAEFYQELASSSRRGLIRTVYNEKYAESGSMYSLFRARDAVGGEDFFLLESDLIYEIRALRELQGHNKGAVILLSGQTNSNDEVWVETEKDGRLKNMSKDPKELSSKPAGELVGVSKLDGRTFAQLCSTAERMFTDSLHVEYEKALVAAADHTPIYCHKVDDLL
ncbi:MAG TPA: phosphocholine cytidylyltransferase family protein, partial [Sediminispirochaeta sp.]|nr:phosphocholine cytidylyltransferase family protein [Sediminispirochaeta sp.]